ncbi:MAG: AAA family ATPase [bacterium]
MTGFIKAVRSAQRLKLGVQGPSGSGKTLGALQLARAIVGPEGRIAVADSENGTASLYSDRVEFDTLQIDPPYLTSKFEAAIKMAVEGEYDIIVLDSISHQWMGEGGILSRKEALDKQGGNSFTNWATFTPEQERFKSAIANAPIHLIATLRSKQEYVVEENARGKQAPKKMGMAPIQREGMEYEFSIVFELQMSHRATVSKDRTGLFASDNAVYDLTDEAMGKTIIKWLKTAKPLPTKAEIAAEAERVLRTTTALPGTSAHFEGWGGKLVQLVPSDVLERALDYLRTKDLARPGEEQYTATTEAIGVILADRAGDLTEAIDTAQARANAAADAEEAPVTG